MLTCIKKGRKGGRQGRKEEREEGGKNVCSYHLSFMYAGIL